MSTTKLDTSGVFQPLNIDVQQTRLTLSADAVRIRKNGIEFHSEQPITPWTEMTVDLFSTADARKVHCTGVVVACNGNRHTGYQISMVFMNLSPQSQERLDLLSWCQRLAS
ncbi:MAG: PilZ domain-containing protein [Verrucomicrobiota bacterium]|nr:PilZ domain-containing protein [Verrucomicrobiota bacterium]